MSIVSFFRHAAQRFWQPKPENSFVFRANEAPESVHFPREFAKYTKDMLKNSSPPPITVEGHVVSRRATEQKRIEPSPRV